VTPRPEPALTGRPVLLGVPFDSASSFLRGPADAPGRIRAALRSDASNPFSEGLVDLAEPHSWGDAGDVVLGESPRDAITSAVARLLTSGDRPIVLGGDHSITYPVLRAVRTRFPRLSILHFDAHNDLYDRYDGDPWSHACPFARIMEESLCDQLVQIGIRTMTRHQRDQAERFGVDVIDMRRWAAGERPALRHPIYVSLDVDVLDPAFAPGVSHRESGGLSVREVLTTLQGLRLPIVGADLVEYNPRRDVEDLTAVACAKLLKELLGVMLGN
jgi:agmatinase